MRRRQLREVARALRITTERLASELARPTDQPPDWSPFEWRIARAVASLHGVSPLLAATLRWRAPADWLAFLADQALHTARRHERVTALMRRLDTAARTAGIPMIGLKGTSLHARGLYVAGTRPMADVDVLVAPADAPRARALIEALGYRERMSMARHIVLEPDPCPPPAPFGENETNGVTIELHARIAEPLPLREVVLETLRPSRPGLGDYPSTAALMAHVLLHASGAMTQRGLRLLHLQDISRLARRLESDDWRALESFGDGRRGLWWAWPPLVLAERYFGGVPREVLQAASAHVPPLLRRSGERSSLADLSLSRLYIQAFPGIEWSSSAAEMVAYGTRRLVPSRAHLRQRRDAARTEASYAGSDWVKRSQFSRIVRWIGTRPPRVGTMHAVRGSLSHPL